MTLHNKEGFVIKPTKFNPFYFSIYNFGDEPIIIRNEDGDIYVKIPKYTTTNSSDTEQ